MTKVWGYEKILSVLGGALIVCGVLMFLVKPFLEKLIAMDKLGHEEEEIAASEA